MSITPVNLQSAIDQNEIIAERFLEYLNSQNIEQFVSLFSEDGTYEEVASGRTYASQQTIGMYIKATLDGIPDSKFELINQVINENVIAIEWVWSGTNSVGWEDMGIPPTDKYFEIKGVSIMNIKKGLISSNRDYWDWNTFINKIK